MAVTVKHYASFAAKALNKEIDFDTDTIKVMLCGSGYTPNQTTHAYKSSVTSEVSGTNYTAGGQTVGSKTVTLSTLTQQFDAADTTFSNITVSGITQAVVYVDTGSAATSALIGYIDFGTTYNISAGDFVIQWAATGIFTGATT